MKSLIKFSLKFLITVIVIAAFVYFGIKYVIPKLEQKDKKENLSADNRLHPVKKIIDGDTFETEIDGRSLKVRMLGIDTPEKFQSEKLERDSERTKRDKNTIMKLGELSYQYTSKLMGGN